MAVLDVETDDGVAVVRLDRPRKRNALDAELTTALRNALIDANRRPEVGAIVLTGADPAFCAGMDLDDLDRRAEFMTPAPEVGGIGPVPPLSKPLIGAVNGPAITGGLELALLCDVLIASNRARFGDAHVRLGLLPELALAVTLPQAVGRSMAIELLLTGRVIDAREALRIGLVGAVVAHEDLLPRARALAGEIVANDSETVRGLLALVHQTSAVAPEEGQAIASSAAREWERSHPVGAGLARQRTFS